MPYQIILFRVGKRGEKVKKGGEKRKKKGKAPSGTILSDTILVSVCWYHKCKTKISKSATSSKACPGILLTFGYLFCNLFWQEYKRNMKRNKYCGLWPGLSVLRNSIPVQYSIFANSWDPGIFRYSIGLRWKEKWKRKKILKRTNIVAGWVWSMWCHII